MLKILTWVQIKLRFERNKKALQRYTKFIKQKHNNTEQYSTIQIKTYTKIQNQTK